VTAPFPDAHRAGRRDLHRDQPGREGIESELVTRLTAGISPEPARRALVRCLDGELTSRAALVQILLASGSVTALRELVDEITARADEDSRAGDSLVRDRADELTNLFIENEEACARAVERLRRSAAVSGVDPEGAEALAAGARTIGAASTADGGAIADPAVDEVAYHERLFERLVRAPS
jgi:hypothetical protein